MKTLTRLGLAAPLALALAACGGAETDERVADDGTTAGVDVDVPEVDVEYPKARRCARHRRLPAHLHQCGQRWRRVPITLGANDSYTMVGADGTETTGTFNWYSDNSRILIRERESQVYAAPMARSTAWGRECRSQCAMPAQPTWPPSKGRPFGERKGRRFVPAAFLCCAA